MRLSRVVLVSVVVLAMLLGPVAALGSVTNTWEDIPDNPVLIEGGEDFYYPDMLYSATRFDGNGADYPYKCWYDDGADTWLAYSEDGEEWEVQGNTPIRRRDRHPQVAYDPAHFGDDQGDLIQASFPETYTVTPYYKMWTWQMSPSEVRFAYSDDGETWYTNYQRDVCPRDEPGWLNPGSPIYDLEVMYDGSSYRGWADNNGRMYNVHSSDGTTWTLDPTNPIAIDLGTSGQWDSASLSRMSVIKKADTEWHAWYGGSTGGGGNQGIGHATSSDGIIWTKNPANPLASLGGYGTYGGLGEPETWNGGRNYALSVVYDSDRFDVRRGDAAMYKMLRSGESTVTDDKSIGFAQDDITWRFHELFDNDRYGTAVAVSQDVFFRGADTVVIATGLDWPDALGGTALAGAFDAPILLVKKDSIPTSVKNEIARLGASKAYVLGGTGAISKAVADELADPSGLNLSVDRLAGSDRYATAELIAEETIDELNSGGGYDGTAFAATGAVFADALSASPLAASQGWPIFLVNPRSGANTTAMKNAGVSGVHVLGGTTAVSAAHEQDLKDEFGDLSVDRLKGDDRYKTSVEVATYGVDTVGLDWNWLAIATGESFPDALSGSMAPATEGGVVMLTRTASLPSPVSTVISDEGDSIRHVFFVGGTVAVSQDVRDSVGALLP